jgi:hypothetical protein
MIKKIKKFRRNIVALKGVLNGAGVRDMILKRGMEVTEGTAFFWGNITKNVQETGKGVLTAHSGKRVATTGYKAAKDFSRGDPICGSLCSFSACCETVSGIVIWIPFPGKVCTISGLKAVSIGCERLRDMCATDPSNPLC